MELVVDDLHPGTDETTWLGARKLAALRPLHQRRPRQLVAVGGLLGRQQMARKRWATYAFTSQIGPLGADYRGKSLLTDSVLRRFWRSFEVFIEA